MQFFSRTTVVTALFLLCLAGPATAQYLKITTDNPTDNTRMKASGTTILTITLNTNHDKDGSLQTCNSHTVSAGCGSIATGVALDMFGYTLALKAVGGTVAWGTFTASDAAYTDSQPQFSNSTEIEINQFRLTGTVTAPGLATIGTLPVTITGGAPAIQWQIGPGALNPFGFGSGFATDCDGFNNPYFYVLADPANFCATGDFVDADGANTAANEQPHIPQIAAPLNATAAEGALMTPIEVTATDPDASRTLTITQSGMPADLTFTTDSPGPSPRHASVSGTPGFDDANVPPAGLGFYRIAFTVSDGTDFGVATAVTALVISNTNRAPTLNPIPNTTLCNGAVVDQEISGSDPDGDALTFSKVAGPFFMTVTTTGPTTGNIHLAPPGSTPSVNSGATVRADDGSFGSADQSFTITITCGNRCPQANPGGPYSGLASVPLTMNGSASSDPDGNPLTYAWDFDASDGIQVNAVGVTAAHGYPAAGTYTVTLTVTDNGDGDPAQICSNSATTTAEISASCPASVVANSGTIRLGSGKPFWFAYVQPATGCYANTDVITASFVLKYAGRQVPAEATKITVGGDKSGDGVEEIKVAFSKENLRALFSGTGLGNGHNLVVVTFEADLTTGGRLSGGPVQVDVVNNGNFTISAVAPNPLNPEAILTYTTSRQGPVRIDMFDIQGRLVRRLVDAPAMGAGTHEAKIDGRGERGEKLPSGVYYIRGTSSEGAFKHLVTILK